MVPYTGAKQLDVYASVRGAADMSAYSYAKLSPNIALDSYVYDYLEELSGLGYVPELLPAIKPYTCMQATHWLIVIDETKQVQPNSGICP